MRRIAAEDAMSQAIGIKPMTWRIKKLTGWSEEEFQARLKAIHEDQERIGSATRGFEPDDEGDAPLGEFLRAATALHLLQAEARGVPDRLEEFPEEVEVEF